LIARFVSIIVGILQLTSGKTFQILRILEQKVRVQIPSWSNVTHTLPASRHCFKHECGPWRELLRWVPLTP